MLPTQPPFFTARRPITILAIASILALATSPTSAQTATHPTPNPCTDSFASISFPRQDWPTLAQAYSTMLPIASAKDNTPPPKPPEACFSIDLYYSHSPDHFQKARYCVLARQGLIRDADPTQVKQAEAALAGFPTELGNILNIDGLVLAMLYGNGEGVARNLPLARALVCRYSDGILADEPAQHLADFNKIVHTGGRFDVCKDSGGSFGRQTNFFCLGLQLERQATDTHHREAAITATLSPPMKPSFLALRSAWKAFHTAYTIMDQSTCSGTGCGPMTEDADLTFTDRWLSALKDIQQGKPPSAATDPSALPHLDQALNIAYQKTLSEPQPCEAASCNIREADRAWLKYREAWVKFGTLLWPEIPADQWRAWQTAQWSKSLSSN